MTKLTESAIEARPSLKIRPSFAPRAALRVKDFTPHLKLFMLTACFTYDRFIFL